MAISLPIKIFPPGNFGRRAFMGDPDQEWKVDDLSYMLHAHISVRGITPVRVIVKPIKPGCRTSIVLLDEHFRSVHSIWRKRVSHMSSYTLPVRVSINEQEMVSTREYKTE